MAGYDQSKIKDLNRLIADHGPFDVVVDDGGHRPEQQKTSFIHLFPHVKPGGLYFLEDIHTAWMDNFGGDSNGNLSGEKTKEREENRYIKKRRSEEVKKSEDREEKH